jgi:hypothetical protein
VTNHQAESDYDDASARDAIKLLANYSRRSFPLVPTQNSECRRNSRISLAFGVLSRDSPKNGHVGVVRGTDGQGNPILVSGNHGPTVTQSVYPKSEVMAYVMPPNYVIEDMAAAARAAAIK